MVHDVPPAGWYRSSRCSSEGGCVEVAPAGVAVAMRDSTLPTGSPYLVFDRVVWRSFVADLKAGHYRR